jgi:imidazolonepropionase-like amidohydrolase
MSPNGAVANLTASITPYAENIIRNLTHATQWVNGQVSDGADYIKVTAEPSGFDQQTLNTLTHASHQRGKRVICHAVDYASAQRAVAANVDQLHHAPLDKALDITLGTQLRNNGQISVPTLAMMKAVVHNFPIRNYSAAKETVNLLHTLGVPILAGTDGNNQRGVPAAVPFGSSMHLEMELLVDAGLSTVEALRAATNLPAKHFGLHDRGSIVPGMRADLLLIDGDPVANIKATRNIKKVWISGVEYPGSVANFEE